MRRNPLHFEECTLTKQLESISKLFKLVYSCIDELCGYSLSLAQNDETQLFCGGGHRKEEDEITQFELVLTERGICEPHYCAKMYLV